jgi:hypothetical protein
MNILAGLPKMTFMKGVQLVSSKETPIYGSPLNFDKSPCLSCLCHPSKE